MAAGIELGEALFDLSFQLTMVDPLAVDRVQRGLRTQGVPIGGVAAGTDGERLQVGRGRVLQILKGIGEAYFPWLLLA